MDPVFTVMEVQHTPVLAQEVVEYLRCGEGGVFVDCTVGGGGHAEAILQSGSPRTQLIGMDRDGEAIERAGRRLSVFSDRVVLRRADFRDLEPVLDEIGVALVDGILMDLGMSSFQVEDPKRGFSFMKNGPLDMRMDPSQGTPAGDLIHRLNEDALAQIFRDYGEERWAGRIARAIVLHRESAPITRTVDLSLVIQRAIPRRFQSRKIHPATRVFQALRIAVNDELNGLRHGMAGAIRRLRGGGRLVIISFHSLEDRIVKHELRKRAGVGEIRIITKRPVTAPAGEIRRNPRSRSAKLRVAERTAFESEASESA